MKIEMKSLFLQCCTKVITIFCRSQETFAISRKSRRRHRRTPDIITINRPMKCHHLMNIIKTRVTTDTLQIYINKNIMQNFSVQAITTSKFYSFITDIGYLAKSSNKILFTYIPNRIHLERDWNSTHILDLSFLNSLHKKPTNFRSFENGRPFQYNR